MVLRPARTLGKGIVQTSDCNFSRELFALSDLPAEAGFAQAGAFLKRFSLRSLGGSVLPYEAGRRSWEWAVLLKHSDPQAFLGFGFKNAPQNN